ncbi:MAG TPA: FAD-dependent oxidoreductase [Chitinophagaceae bacterium]|nr:FAD-dependent oxidoreductase [Chitinophagaceae bacterium]
MQKKITLRLKPSEASNEDAIIKQLAAVEGVNPSSITGYYPEKRSIDARSRQPWINLTLVATLDEPFINRPKPPFQFKNVQWAAKRVVIIGAGPAGLFAALELLQLGVKPVILERGKNVKDRRRDLAVLNKEGIVNPDSNYCFGEGGAGTYSDGKLYTRSNKRGNISKVLDLLVHFGADEKILYESHPHIGTNKLPKIITAIREHIIHCGGEVHFGEKLVDFDIRSGKITAALTAQGNRFEGDEFILATGHSARDIYELLHQKNIQIEAKPFALGVRVEHPQELIDKIQYHCTTRDPDLPPAAYSLVEQVSKKGVFSFCMCPGGIIAPAATSPGELVVNGWSPSKRDNEYANSGMVVEVNTIDILSEQVRNYFPGFVPNPADPLLLMKFQQLVEKRAFEQGGGYFVAPAQRMSDFSSGKRSSNLPGCSYIPGLQSADLKDVLPPFIHQRLQDGFIAFGKKMKGYLTNEAVVVATESRTSSPVRIPRTEDFHHPQITNLYPCGEGAGYAGGIVSAAMDGERIATTIALLYK